MIKHLNTSVDAIPIVASPSSKLQTGRILEDRRPYTSIVCRQFDSKTLNYDATMALPSSAMLYAETPLARKLGYANGIKYSTSTTFRGIKRFENNNNRKYATDQWCGHARRYYFQRNVNVAVAADMTTTTTTISPQQRHLKIVEDSKSAAERKDVLPMVNMLIIDYAKPSSTSVSNIVNNTGTTFTARMDVLRKQFNVMGATYALSVAIEAPITVGNTATPTPAIKLKDATKCHQINFWHIRCIFNDDDQYTFRIVFHRDIFYPSDDVYTMTVECIDQYIDADQFVVVADLLYKFYKTQRLVRGGTIAPTFAAISAIRDLSAEQKMLLATMELVPLQEIDEQAKSLATMCNDHTITFVKNAAIKYSVAYF